MKAVLAAVMLLGLGIGSFAHATPAPMIRPPAGWAADPERASTLSTKVAALSQFGGAKVIVATEAYVPAAPGVALFVTRISAEKLPGSTANAARAALEDFRTSAPRPYAWQDFADTDSGSYVARAEWLDLSVHTQTVATLVIVGTASGLVTVRGECLSADGGDAAPVNACTQALHSLETGVPKAERLAITMPPEPEPEPVRPHEEPARLTDGQEVHLTPMTIAQTTPERDRRPIYLGAGIVVLAAAFWWNRRQRERFDREDSGEPRAATREAREARARGDDDADDLAAAARGDEPKDET